MLPYIVIGLLCGLIPCTLFYFLVIKKQQQQPQDFSKQVAEQLNAQILNTLNQAGQTLTSQASQHLNAQKQEIITDTNAKTKAMETMVNEIRKQMEESNKRLELAEQNRIGSFSTLTQKLDEQRLVTEQLRVTADSLKKVLSNNQLRGAFGEQIAEDLLKIAGFVPGVDYEKQLSGDTSRPDFTLYMPDGTKINVDAKFPYSNLVKMSETEDPIIKDQSLRAFAQDIKTKIKEVSSRDYIDPSQKTVDFVILFIPNEMIFSYVYEKFPEIWQEAMAKKVILAGPFSFTAVLRLIRQAHDSFKIQKNTQAIIAHIQLFEKEFSKYNEEFEKIGERLNQLNKQYDSVNTTRSRQLLRVVDKIKIEGENSTLDTPPLIS